MSKCRLSTIFIVLSVYILRVNSLTMPAINRMFKNVMATSILSIYFNAPVGATITPIYGSDDIMKQKIHGTSNQPVQNKLRFGVDIKLADKISNYNR